MLCISLCRLWFTWERGNLSICPCVLWWCDKAIKWHHCTLSGLDYKGRLDCYNGRAALSCVVINHHVPKPVSSRKRTDHKASCSCYCFIWYHCRTISQLQLQLPFLTTSGDKLTILDWQTMKGNQHMIGQKTTQSQLVCSFEIITCAIKLYDFMH